MDKDQRRASPIVRVAIAGLGAAGSMMIPALLKHPVHQAHGGRRYRPGAAGEILG